MNKAKNNEQKNYLEHIAHYKQNMYEFNLATHSVYTGHGFPNTDYTSLVKQFSYKNCFHDLYYKKSAHTLTHCYKLIIIN